MKFLAVFSGIIAATLVAASPLPEDTTSASDAANVFDKRDVNCFLDNGVASSWAINEGIDYLLSNPNHSPKADVVIPADSKSRVSCSYNSAIWVENKTPYNLVVPWRQIASDTQKVVDKCCKPHSKCSSRNSGVTMRGGNVGDNFNVLVGHSSC